MNSWYETLSPGPLERTRSVLEYVQNMREKISGQEIDNFRNEKLENVALCSRFILLQHFIIKFEINLF